MGDSLELGIDGLHDFEVDGRLLTDIGGTLGFEVCVKHVAAAARGSRCTASARLEQIVDDRKLRFAVEVVAEEGRTIGVGTHERRIIDAGPAAA